MRGVALVSCLLLLPSWAGAVPQATDDPVGDPPPPLVAPEGAPLDDDPSVRAKPPTRRRLPPADRPAPVLVQEANPATVALGAAGGAALGTLVGAASIAAAGYYAAGLGGSQPDAVIVATTVLSIGAVVATPFLAAFAGGAAVLLLDPRTRPEEWAGLLQCAAAGYCTGLAAVASALLGGGVFCGTGLGHMPGPDRPAEWTAAATIGGLLVGAAVGTLVGYNLAPDADAAAIPLAVGGLGGAVFGASAGAALGAGIATAVRR